MRTVLFLTLFLGCRPRPISGPPLPAPTHQGHPLRADPTVAGIESPALQAVVLAYWDGAMARDPLWATSLSDHRFDHLVSDPSPRARTAWNNRQAGWSHTLHELSGLSDRDRVTAQLLVSELDSNLAQVPCHFEEWLFSPRDNPLLDANGLGEQMRVQTPRDAENFVLRIRGLAANLGPQADNLRRGAKRGRVGNAHSIQLVMDQVRRQLAADDTDWPMLLPLKATTRTWSSTDEAAFRASALEAFHEYRRALKQWLTVVDTEILPVARQEESPPGLSSLPDGAACYAAMIKHHTTLPLSANEVHQIGLDEIRRLHSELSMLGKRSFDQSDIQKIFHYLRTDKNLYFHTEDEVEAKAQQTLARAKAAIPTWFGRLPRADCEVARIPDYQAPYTTIAYYQPVIPGERPGYYYVNTYAPETRPRHEAEVLAFHESIPGHHLQMAIGAELGELPMFRRHLGITAFVEGWALYSEQLADEMGLYSTDTDRLGMYSFELWRAARLVVDTGIHAQGWSRAQAIEYMVENTPLARNNIVNEVDRYINTPGQALAYKIGQLEIWKLRHEAQTALGDSFSIQEFHDIVLGGGAVTLPVLRERVERWIQTVKKP